MCFFFFFRGWHDRDGKPRFDVPVTPFFCPILCVSLSLATFTNADPHSCSIRTYASRLGLCFGQIARKESNRRKKKKVKQTNKQKEK